MNNHKAMQKKLTTESRQIVFLAFTYNQICWKVYFEYLAPTFDKQDKVDKDLLLLWESAFFNIKHRSLATRTWKRIAC